MPQVDDDNLLALAARLCYLEDVPQQEAAAMLKVSQAKISRMLAAARKRGIVQISVKDCKTRDEELERALKARFPSLKFAFVAKNPVESLEEGRRLTGRFGGRALAKELKGGWRIGLVGGRTVASTVEGMLLEGFENPAKSIQLMGNIAPEPKPWDASELTRKLASGRCEFMALPSPVFVGSKEARDGLLEAEPVKSVFKACKSLDMALLGVGIPESSLFQACKLLSREDAAKLRAQGVAGEICGRFFDGDGRELETPFSGKVVSIEFDALRKTPLKLAAVFGEERAAALAAAIKGKLVNAVVIDEALAKKTL